MYVINIGKEDKIHDHLRKIIKTLGEGWKNTSLNLLIDNKSLGDYMNKRK
jgi:hypothetical protein